MESRCVAAHARRASLRSPRAGNRARARARARRRSPLPARASGPRRWQRHARAARRTWAWESGARAAAAARNGPRRRSAPARLALVVLLERRGCGKLVHRMLDLDALARAEVGDGGREIAVADGVQRMRGRGPQAARKLVQTLRAALEARDPALDAELDRLVIARLEMQARNVLRHPPVAAPQRL